MSIEVTTGVFDFFKSKVGSWVGQDEELADLHEWMSLDLDYLDVIEFPSTIDLDRWSDDFLEDWDKLNHWWDGVAWIDDYDCDDPNDKPLRLFKDRNAVIRHIVQTVASKEDGDNLVGCVELTHSGESLYLVYTDFDSWILSSGNSVWVIESLDEVNEANGFYRFR